MTQKGYKLTTKFGTFAVTANFFPYFFTCSAYKEHKD